MSEHENLKEHQRNKSRRFADRKPSEVTDLYWIYAENVIHNYRPTTEQSGKWLVFVPFPEVDEWWAKIKKATEEGLLGDSSKVASARPNPNATDSEKKVICVYSYDWTDEEDVMRIRDELRKLGVTWKIAYKSDEDTLAGKYRVRGNTRISKYYC